MKFHFLNEGTFQGGGEWNSIIIFVGAGEGGAGKNDLGQYYKRGADT